jgi:NAD(P)-dependent dehydrogenase (short-subunit alcohol dehydrogenase family)
MQNIRLKPLNEQVVVVFGASTGIGRMTALKFADNGAKLVVVGRKQEALDSLAHEIKSRGSEALAVTADTTHFPQVVGVAEAALRKFGRIDTWAHIAGVGVYSRFTDLKPEEFRRSIEVNLLGQVYGAMAAIPHLRRKGGALIQVSSIESQIGFPFQSAYAAAKHGMKGYLDVLRMELEHDHVPVSVTNIMPMAIDTPFFSHALTKLGVKPRAMPPIYKPELVAEAIVKAAYKPQGDVIVGGAGFMFLFMKRFMPRLLEKLMITTAFRGQMTRLLKPAGSPSELFAAETGDIRIHGNLKPSEPKARLA